MAEPAVDTFSYAEPDDPRLKRFVIRIIERMSGQPYLKWLYEENQAHPIPGESFWDSAIRLLELKMVFNDGTLAKWPKTGPLIVVSNHPFGVLDGVVISQLVSRIRQDFRVLTNAVLYRAEEIREFLLPIDFTETEEALKTNLKSRAEAKAHLLKGGCLVVFPAGGVSTTPTVWHKRAIDTEWKTFTARLITQAKAPVAPVFFAGQNSRIFQLASHISMTLRLSLLFKEVHDKIGSEVVMRIGEPIPYDRLPDMADRQAFMSQLRDMTYALGEGVADPPKSKVKRPLRAPKEARRARKTPA
jgi:putative hemolysin